MKMTLLQHFAELRRRVLWLLAWFVVAFCIGWWLAPYIQGFLTAPLIAAWKTAAAGVPAAANPLCAGQDVLLYTGLTDGLMIQFELATLFAMFATVPAVLWHVWAYVAPALRDAERRFIGPVLIISPALFLGGMAFAYFVMFPMAFKFFIELNKSAHVPIAFMPVMGNYLSFTIALLKIFGLAFQMPLVLVLLNRIGLLSRAAVVRARRYAIVGFFIVAAFLAPPDVMSQIMLALPLWGLFEISILFMKSGQVVVGR
ncbi:MAG: twin-arginine translocase subunit TatC [Proteobacteria bacterium]|nr:twin-arginine translocase subunit TatC [Pseudomonadota bacterium]